MEQRGAKYGTKSPLSRRRLNVKQSVKRLEELLALNFTDSARFVVLTYDVGQCPRSRALAGCLWRDWAGAVRRIHQALGVPMRYVVSLSWNPERGAVKHMAVLDGAGGLPLSPALWPHGGTEETPVDLTHGWAQVAALMMQDVVTAERTLVPCARSWTASLGLPRPGHKDKEANESSERQ